MLVHVVLFRPKPDLSQADQELLLQSFTNAVREIPSLVRASVGPRVTHGAGYEPPNADAFPYAAMLEFNDLAGLQEYLTHSAHAEPARMFFAAIEASMIADYQIQPLGPGPRA